MYAFDFDVHDGAFRLTVFKECSWLWRKLTGQSQRKVAEWYLDRRGAAKLASKMMKTVETSRYLIKPSGSA